MDEEALRARLAATPALRATGRVRAVTGLALRCILPGHVVHQHISPCVPQRDRNGLADSR